MNAILTMTRLIIPALALTILWVNSANAVSGQYICTIKGIYTVMDGLPKQRPGSRSGLSLRRPCRAAGSRLMPASVKDALKRKIGKGFYTAWTHSGHSVEHAVRRGCTGGKGGKGGKGFICQST